MRLLSARLKGLIGVARSSGQKEIFIDFTKCKNNITLIIGPNGSGKTTIIDSLHPLPESQTVYLPKEEGFKELEYINRDIRYKIRIEYPIDKYKKRTVTKAYISKNTDGEYLELNPNGNIGSYKETLFSEFKLDSNYIALTQLSVEDKGIVEKTPSQRKVFVGSIISSIEVYNNIHKTMNKRSSVFKSMINSVSSKIDSIGNEEQLLANQSNLTSRIKSLSERKSVIERALVGHEAKINLIDPNGEIQTKYNNIRLQIDPKQELLGTLKLQIKPFLENSGQSYDKMLETTKNDHFRESKEMVALENTIDSYKEKIQDLLVSREEESKAIVLKQNRLGSLKSESNYDELSDRYDAAKEIVLNAESVFKNMGMNMEDLLSKDEFVLGINTLKAIKEQVDVVRSYNSVDQLQKAIEYSLGEINIQGQINELEQDWFATDDMVIRLKDSIKHTEDMKEKLSILDNRPKDCIDDTCPFIKDAIKYSNYDVDKILKDTQSDYDSTVIKRESLRDDIEELKSILGLNHSINIIIRYINNNKTILDRLPNGDIFGNRDKFLDLLLKGSTFNEINDIYAQSGNVNLFELYKYNKDLLVNLSAEMKIHESKNEIVDGLLDDIEVLSGKISKLSDKIQEYNNEIYKCQATVQEISSRVDTLSSLVEKLERISDLEEEIDMLRSHLAEVTSDIAKIEESVNGINNCKSELLAIENDLTPLTNERDSIKYNLDRLVEYKSELEELNKSYSTIELLKKYSSPTKAGIQNLFIKIYMGQTLSITNSLLGMMFGGRLRLGEYIIDDKEFRIPCTSLESPIMNDDISSCSTAEKSMISMILSFALLKQSATDYNILRLDEIDGGLDVSNRGLFVSVLQDIMSSMSIEQTFMISHNSEASLDNADIIYLGNSEVDKPSGNIIFEYGGK